MPTEDCIDSIAGAPILKALLQLLPSEALLAFGTCSPGLASEVRNADDVWEYLLCTEFGGCLSTAQKRCPHADTPYATFAALAMLRQRLAAVEVKHGDLRQAATFGVDCVVYPTNPTLEPYGPTARAIFDAAGSELVNHMAALKPKPRNVEPGTAIWTPGCGLGTAGLVHVVGPNLRTPDRENKLHETYAAAFSVAAEHGHHSVAIGSISTGGNGIELGLATPIAVEEFRAALGASLEKSPKRPLRIVVVAYDEEVASAFRASLSRILRHVNKNLVEVLPIVVLDAMLPGQRLSFSPNSTDFNVGFSALPPSCQRFGMVGSQTGRVLPVGVEANVRSSSSNSSTHLEIVAGRRFVMVGNLYRTDATPDEHGRYQLQAAVEWVDEDFDEDPLAPVDLKRSEALEPLVAHWLNLVRSGHERQLGQIDLVLGHLGPMPPAAAATDRAIWVCALINPLPALGVCYEIRPNILLARNVRGRLAVATTGLLDSIAHLDGSQPMTG